MPTPFCNPFAKFAGNGFGSVFSTDGPRLPKSGLLMKYSASGGVDSIGEQTRNIELKQSIKFDGTSTDYVEIPLTGADIDEVRGVLRVDALPTATKYVLGSKGLAQRFMLSIGVGGNFFGSLGDNTSILGVVAGVAVGEEVEVGLKDNGDNTGTLTVGEMSDTEAFTGDSNNTQNIYIGAVNNNGVFLGGHVSYWHSLEFYNSGVLVASISHAEKMDSTSVAAVDSSLNGNSGTVNTSDTDAMISESLLYGSDILNQTGEPSQAVLSGVI